MWVKPRICVQPTSRQSERKEPAIAQSPLYPHGTNYKLRHTEAKASSSATVTHDEDGEPVAETTGPSKAKTFDFEVQLEPQGDGNQQARLGVDTSTVDFEGQIVKTNWPTLTFPTGVGGGSTFDLTYNGKKGRLTLGAALPAQHPTEARVVGQEFVARWQAS